MISTKFEAEGTVVAGADPTEADPNRSTLIYRVAVQSPIAPPHMFQIPGEAMPALIEMLQGVCKEYPALTIERASEGTSVGTGLIKDSVKEKPSGIVVPIGAIDPRKKGN